MNTLGLFDGVLAYGSLVVLLCAKDESRLFTGIEQHEVQTVSYHAASLDGKISWLNHIWLQRMSQLRT